MSRTVVIPRCAELSLLLFNPVNKVLHSCNPRVNGTEISETAERAETSLFRF